jgi:hypothetical protein
MHFYLPLILGFTATSLARCGTAPPSNELRDFHGAYAAQYAASKHARSEQLETVEITTFCHVISIGDTPEEGNLAQSTIEKQARLNPRYTKNI